KWLDDQRILIYVRANKGNKEQALKRIRSTLEWRCTYRPHAITPEDMRLEGATGKQYMNGFDKGGRPILYMFPHRQNTKDAKEQLRWVVFTIEQAIRAMPEGASKITIVIDVSKYSMSQSVPLSTAREFLNILESHYPERLNKAFVLSPPTIFVMFYHIVAPFIDPVTKTKIAFVDVNGTKGKGKSTKPDAKTDGPWVDILDYIEPTQLQSDAGGEWSFRYEQDCYWPAL
ncbi:CRAL/TRIO domain-containing protein, partial [Martensiomyces pterosporus]